MSELIAWIAGPWAVPLLSNWLFLPSLVLLFGLPAVFSTQNDKRQIIVSTPGPVRVGIEVLLYSVAGIVRTLNRTIAHPVVLSSITKIHTEKNVFSTRTSKTKCSPKPVRFCGIHDSNHRV
jgi:hypothetical protein